MGWEWDENGSEIQKISGNGMGMIAVKMGWEWESEF